MMLAAALSYASADLHVFPCEPRGKRPAGNLVPHGVKQATTDHVIITRWWTLMPDANIGIAICTGALSSVRVLDIDPKHGGDRVLAALLAKHDWLPTTLEQRTGSGGSHYLLTGWPSCDLKTKLISQDSGVELLGVGRYFIAAPSVHPDGGSYEWLVPVTTRIAAAPLWLVALATREPEPQRQAAAPTGPKAARGALLHAVRRIEESPAGDRNNTLNRMSYWVARIVSEGNISESLARSALIDAGCAAGMPAFEVKRTVESALRARKRSA